MNNPLSCSRAFLTACRGMDTIRVVTEALIPVRRIKNEMATSPPTQEVFDKLLLCLAPDRERAGEEYELLRFKLLEYFRARACFCDEELADEVLNRLAQKVAAGEPIREIRKYCYGLA